MGVWDGKPDATPLESAQAELREETGLRAEQMELFADFFPDAGFWQRKSVICFWPLI